MNQTATFLVQANYYFTFRNPKGAAAASQGAKMAIAQASLPPEAKLAEISESDFANDQQTLLDEDTRI